jgi:hypothetical protein
MNSHQKNLIRHEAFVQGFVAARAPKKPGDVLLACEEAERAWAIYLEQRRTGAAQ